MPGDDWSELDVLKAIGRELTTLRIHLRMVRLYTGFVAAVTAVGLLLWMIAVLEQ